MPRRRKPLAIARATGADLKNPARYRKRSDPATRPLGLPYTYLTGNEKKIWAEVAAEMPWLRASDRQITAIACRLWSRFISDPEPDPKLAAQMRLCLSAMGGTPSDRSKVGLPELDDRSAADEFLN